MTTPTGVITMNDVRIELAYGGSSITFNDSAVRTLAGKSSGTISMYDMRGKPTGPGSVSYPVADNYMFEETYDTSQGDNTGEIGAKWGSDGVLYSFSDKYSYQSIGNWTTGTPSGFWIRFTRAAPGSGSSPTNITTRSTASTGWMQMNSDHEIVFSGTWGLVKYTVDIATDSAGSNIVSSRTFFLQLTDGYV